MSTLTVPSRDLHGKPTLASIPPQDAIMHGLYVQLLRFAPDVLSGLLQLEDVKAYVSLLETLHGSSASTTRDFEVGSIGSMHAFKSVLDAARRLEFA